MKQRVSEVYSEPSQTSKMELLVKIVNSRNPLIIFVKCSIFDCVLNTPLALDVNEVCFGDEPISLIRMKIN